MNPSEALAILDRAAAAADGTRSDHNAIMQAVQVLAPIVAAHEAKAKAEAEHSAP